MRDADGNVSSLSASPSEGAVAASMDDQEVKDFLRDLDVDLVRVLEDVIDLLISRGVFRFTDLPESAREKLMFRRNLADATDVAYYLVHAPADTSLEQMVEAAGTRWPVEECFEKAKGEVGLDEYEVRTYTAWYRHITLCMVALAFLAGARVVAHSQEEPLRPKVLALPKLRQGMRRFRRRRGLNLSGFRFKRSDG